MKRRIRKVVNFFAFNLLFFALYLNFIHKDDSNTIAGQTTASADQPTVSIKKQENINDQKTTVAVSSVLNVSSK